LSHCTSWIGLSLHLEWGTLHLLGRALAAARVFISPECGVLTAISTGDMCYCTTSTSVLVLLYQPARKSAQPNIRRKGSVRLPNLQLCYKNNSNHMPLTPVPAAQYCPNTTYGCSCLTMSRSAIPLLIWSWTTPASHHHMGSINSIEMM
jgi:hypothetical protein